MVDLVVVGSVALDNVETPHGKVEDEAGGSATFFSMSSSFFTRVGLVGVVGSDYPTKYRAMLETHGIDLSGLTTLESGETFRWSGRYEGTMNEAHTLDTRLNVFAQFQPILPDGYRSSPFLFLANIDPGLQGYVLDQMEKPLFVALDTMNFWINGARSTLVSTLKRIDGLLVNDAEARQLSGETNICRAIEMIHQLGPRFLVVKRGEHGALLSTPNGYFAVPAMPMAEVCDPTGAGDSFAGGFMGFLARRGAIDEGSLRQAVVAGTIMASFCCEGFGPSRFKTLEEDEIRARGRAFRCLTEPQPLDMLL